MSPAMIFLKTLAVGVLTALAPTAAYSATTAAKVTAAAPVMLPKDGLPTVWLQGEPVKDFKPGTLYIFEFWATWCGPCIAAMPHMEALHQKFKDNPQVRIVGVNVMDRVPPEKLLPFLKGRQLDLHYTMAADGSAESVKTHWLKPLGITGIPHAVAVRDGRVLWRGHPASLEVPLIEAMTKPDFSPDQAPPTKENLHARFAPQIKEAQAAAAKGDVAAAAVVLRKLAAECPDEAVVLSAVEFTFFTCARAERPDDAFAMAGLMVELFPKNRKAQLKAGHLAVNTEELEKKDPALAMACAERLLAVKADDVPAMELKAAALLARGDKAAAITQQEAALKATALHRKIEALRAKIATPPAAK